MKRTESARSQRLPTAPLAPAAVAMAAGIILDRYLWAGATLGWITAALAAAAVAAVCDRRATGLTYAAILAAWVSVGGAWHHARWFDLRPDDIARRVSASPQPAWLRGVLVEVPSFRPGSGRNEAGNTRTVLAVSQLSDGQIWQAASGEIQLIVAGDRTDLQAGDSVSAVGQFGTVPGPLNPGEFDYSAYLRGQGIRARLVAGDAESVWSEPPTASPLNFWRRAGTRWIGSARAWSHAHLIATLDPRIAPLAAALLLGRREAVDPDVNDAFARTGTTHLLAISGLHLQVLAAALWFLLRLVGVPRRGSFLIVGLVTVGYALLVGLAPSVVRSAAMTVMICVGSMRDRTTRAANVLALAALVTMLLNPAHLFDVGCQLSFLAVAAIAWGVGPVATWSARPLSPLDRLERRYEPSWRRQARRWQATIVEGVLISCVVWVVTLPLVSLRFHMVSPIGILLNIPLIPITSLALMAAGVTLLASAVWAPLGVPAAWSCAWLLQLTEWLVQWGSAQSWGHLFVPGPSWWWVGLFYLGLAAAAIASRAHWPGWRWGSLALGVWVAWGTVQAAQPNRPRTLEADILSVGHGLAVLVQAPDGRALLYDCGRMGDPQIGRRVIAPALWSRGLHRIDMVILSHADSDHYNALPDLLERFSIGAVCLAPGFAGSRNPGAVRLLQQVRDRGIPIRILTAGQRLPFGPGIELSLLHPQAGWRPDASDNDHSLVVDISASGRHVLLLGDLEQVGLTHLVEQPARHIDALVAPHHGGRTANPPLLYEWADPPNVIVSQRRPAVSTREPLGFLADQGVSVLRTWQGGAVTLRWASSGLAVEGFLDSHAEPKGSRAIMAPALVNGTWWHAIVAVAAFLAGLALCITLAAIEWGAWILVRPGRRLRPVEHPPGRWEFVEAQAKDGTRLVGLWHPGSPATGRTAILLHGFAEDRSVMLNRAQPFVERGWNVLLPDARGHGQSAGDHASFGGREAGDLSGWIDVLGSRAGPATQFAVWGRSMGAAVALRAASDDSRITALILEAPYPDLELAVEGWLARLRVPRPLARPIIHRAAALAGVPLHQPRPLELAPGVHVPTLILHGTDDPIVKLTDAQRLAQAFPTRPDLIDVPGARHVDVIDVGGTDLLDRITGFLDRVLDVETEPNADGGKVS